ncbi:MAG: hypothetical protein RL404_655 [Pseudomonadota bacterium]
MRRAALHALRCGLPLCRLVAGALLASPALATVTVTDDGGHPLSLPRPAVRIVSLAPHATELLFAAGAGGKLVGVSEFSNYPPEAGKLPSIGSSMQLDIERIVSLKPDLIIAWQSGNNARQVARLRKLGYPVFDSEPRRLDDIARTLENFGTLAGSEQGRAAARDFRQRQQSLRKRYAGKAPVRVFYQIWPSPLMTLNDQHIGSDALAMCGAVNVFGQLPQLAPTISRESVVEARPEAIFSSDERNEGWERWRSLPQIPAVRLDNLYRIDGAVMNRAGPRMLDAAEVLCRQIDAARTKLAAAAAAASPIPEPAKPMKEKP